MREVRDVVIVNACRTAIGTMLGSLADIHPREFGIETGKECFKRTGVAPDLVDEIVVGCVFQSGLGGNVARQIGHGLGMNPAAGAVTVNQLDASSMRAFEVACQNIMVGQTEVAMVCGIENMSRAPYLVANGRDGYRMGDGKLEDSVLKDGLVCSIAGYHVGVTAENIAGQYGITRREQDELALLSQKRLATAKRTHRFFDGEITSIPVKTKIGTIPFDHDEYGRPETTMESLAGLPPLFKQDGTVTAGNAAGVNDAGCAALLMSQDKARELGLTPMARVIATACVGVPAEVMGLGPARAIPRALKFAGLDFKDVKYWEINETFAAQWLGMARMLKDEQGWIIDTDRVNHNGSGISLGHPLGCTGLRVIISCLYEMRRTGVAVGGASLCAGGGPAMATLLTTDI